MKTGTTWLLIAFATLVSAAALQGDPLGCNLTAYKGTPGLTAAMAANVLTVTWDGDRNQEVRVRLDVTRGTPTFEVIEVRHKGGTWGRLASNVTPDFRVVSGLRRMSNQQMSPLRGLGVALTPEILDRFRWEPFWDAPLDMSPSSGRGGNPPPVERVANQPGLPRDPNEIKRASAVYDVTGRNIR